MQIITQQPKVEQEEINRVKEELRDYTDRINKGESSFQTLARLYSEDPGTARRGGELDYTGRGMLDPAFANVAFGLTDPKRVSKIVESEFGFHIIQLIDKRGDKIKVRHILRKPVVNDEAINKALTRLDSIRTDIVDGKFPFEAGARAVDTLSVGGISKPFTMINERGKTVCAIVKLKSRIDGHKATITEDFQILKNLVLAKRRNQVLHDWVVKRIKSTYVRINERYRDCDFEYEGWVR